MRPNLKVTPETKTDNKPVVAAAKQKAAGFVNWTVCGADGKPQLDANGRAVLRSGKGFSIFLNEHCSLEEKALLDLAEKNGGEAIVLCEMRIMIAKEKPASIDTSGIQLIKRAI